VKITIFGGPAIRTGKCSTVLWHLICCQPRNRLVGIRPVQDGDRISRFPAGNGVSSLYMISMIVTYCATVLQNIGADWPKRSPVRLSIDLRSIALPLSSNYPDVCLSNFRESRESLRKSNMTECFFI